ncbi:MAG: formylmethanofuran dehydrogenase [Proteobacteria bacterium]|nr:formylmethanofuran dehydrogenase [Pseudomonadota bacterium]MBU1696203.1 formylmethanofuran dehydrogenase [Pseudomonadota bacterium]
MKDFETLVSESARIHGHLCPGQVVGVRMAMLGCRLIGLDDPQCHTQIKKLIVFIEMDRCAGDAVAHVTGVKLGRRSLKFMDYGIMAATFINLETNKAFRIISTEEARELAPFYAPDIVGKSAQQLEAYKLMPDSVLFRVQRVNVHLDEHDMPGPTRKKTTCKRCGQVVRDQREVMIDKEPVCQPCTDNAYFSDAHEITWEHMDWIPNNGMDIFDEPLNKTTIKRS